MFQRGIRGAITIEENTESQIKSATVELLTELLKSNDIKKEDISSLIFTITKDIDVAFPAKFAREELGFNYVPMMCFNEANIKGSLKMCIRVLMNVNTTKKQNEIKHIYLKGAKVLRKDLV